MTDLIREIRAIRAIGDQGEIEGYLAVWGSPKQRDSYNTWWDKSQPPDLGLKDGTFLPVRLMYEHGLDKLNKTIVGKVMRVWHDELGIKYRGLLDKAGQFFDKVLNEIRAGELGTSTASAEHLADFDKQGRFVNWYLTEVSLTKNPAEERMPSVALIRSADGLQRLSISSDEKTTTRDDPGGAPAGDAADRGSGEPKSEPKTLPKGTKRTMKLTLEMLGIAPGATMDEALKALTEAVGKAGAQAMIGELMGGASSAPVDDPNADPNAPVPEMMSADNGRSKKKPAAPAPKAEENGEIATLRSQVEALQKKIETEPPADAPPPVRGNGQHITLGDELKFYGKSHSDMELAYQIMRSRNIQPSQDFMRVFGGKVADAIEKGNQSLAHPTVRSSLKAVRANEIAISTASGGGDEWVTIDYASTIWAATRNDLIVDRLIAKGIMVKEVAKGAESVQFPTEGADPTVYTIAQNGSLSSSRPPVNIGVTRIGTGNVVCTPGELGAAVAWSDVFDEDSIIMVASQYNYQITTKLKETIDQLFINADSVTGASANINLIDGTPATGLTTPYYIATNGALKYALVTGSNTSRDGTTLDETDYRLTAKLMTAPTRTKLAQLTFVIDADTHSASLDIPAIKTEDVKRTNATIVSGVLTNIYGIDVFQTGLMPLANSTGKVPAAGGTLGRILCVYAPYWGMGWKRQIIIETDRDILTGDNILVAKMRVGFAARGADAATVTYNLTV